MPRWLIPVARPAAAVRLFCLPHAGGSPAFFNAWPAVLPDVEVAIADLSDARGRPDVSLQDLASALAGKVGAGGGQWAVYGHSMGGLIACAIARQACARGLGASGLLLPGACAAPQTPVPAPDGGDDGLRRYVARLDSRSRAVLDDPEAGPIALNAVREDLDRVARHKARPDAAVLPCPITAYGGQSDPLVSLEGLEGWARHTTAAFALELIPGGHFFPLEAGTLFLSLLADRLAAHGRQ